MKKFILIFTTAIIFLSFVIFINKDVIFQEGNPLPIFKGILQLNDTTTFVKIKENPTTFITMTNNYDELFSYVKNNSNVDYKEQMGAGYIFRGKNKTVVLTSHQFTKHYQIWKYNTREFKVVGYYSGDLFNEPIEKLKTDKLTHIMYAFIIPKDDGNLVELENPKQLSDLVSQAHRDNAKVFISLGGWSYEGKLLEPVFKEIASSENKRKIFIENICALVEEYSLDGVELDWEHPNKSTAADYEKLVIELSDALNSQGKDLTAALNGSWYDDWGGEEISVISNESLDRFNFISVMAYDMNNDNHSPIWFFENSITYWLNRGLLPEKIVMGMPLYAKPSWLQYRQLVDINPDYAYIDYAPTAPLESYYNGLKTLREKTVIAMKRAGGVMLFDVNEDTQDDETSVVTMIDQLLSE